LRAPSLRLSRDVLLRRDLYVRCTPYGLSMHRHARFYFCAAELDNAALTCVPLTQARIAGLTEYHGPLDTCEASFMRMPVLRAPCVLTAAGPWSGVMCVCMHACMHACVCVCVCVCVQLVWRDVPHLPFGCALCMSVRMSARVCLFLKGEPLSQTRCYCATSQSQSKDI
jgi:hypothetical protein